MKKLFVFAALLVTSFNVNAALFQGHSSGVFDNATGQSGMVTAGQGTDHFTWGKGAYSHSTGSWFWKQNHYHNPSKLSYSGKSFDVGLDTAFEVGSLFFRNGIINAGTGAETVDFSLALDFTVPSLFSNAFNFDFALNNTTNPNGDTVSLLSALPSYLYSHEGQDYYFELLGFKSGGQILDQIFEKEGKSDHYKLVGQFSALPSEVPLPAAIWLFGSGLIGFMAVRRNAKKKV